MIRTILALGMAAAAVPALADEVEGTVLAHDRVAHRVVMNDRSIYEYNAETTELPRAILAGDRIKITYRGGEDGIESIQKIEIVEQGGASAAGGGTPEAGGGDEDVGNAG